MSATPLSRLSFDELSEFLNSFDTVLTDCDGVLWLDTIAIEGAVAALDTFRHLGKKVFYITNNSSKTRKEFVSKCRSLGFKANEDEILSTAYLTACYLSDMGFKGKAYIIGSTGITQELDAVGINHTDIGPDNLVSDYRDFIKDFKKDPDINAVIVGFDEHYNFLKMMKAANYLNDPNCLFIATNTDERFPMKTENIIPGTGCIVVGVETCSGREAFKIGKPSPYIRELLIKQHKINPNRTLMIGDRGNTDILLGTRCGFKTLLVLTGVTSIEELKQWQDSDKEELRNCIPDFYLDKLGDLVHLVKSKAPCSSHNVN